MFSAGMRICEVRFHHICRRPTVGVMRWLNLAPPPGTDRTAREYSDVISTRNVVFDWITGAIASTSIQMLPVWNIYKHIHFFPSFFFVLTINCVVVVYFFRKSALLLYII